MFPKSSNKAQSREAMQESISELDDNSLHKFFLCRALDTYELRSKC